MRGNCETAKMGKDIKSRRDAVSGLKESLGADRGWPDAYQTRDSGVNPAWYWNSIRERIV